MTEHPDPEKRIAGSTYDAYPASLNELGAVEGYTTKWEYLKHYITSREGWIGDYASQ